MNLSLFSSLEQIKKEEQFLNKTLLIKTNITGSSIDDLFYNCQHELDAYEIPSGIYPSYDFMPSPPVQPSTVNSKRFNQLLKENCVIATYYSVKALICGNRHTPFHELVSEYIPKSLDKNTEKRILECYFTAWENAQTSTYLNKHILRLDAYSLNDFCSDLSMQLVLNNSRGASVLEEEEDSNISSFQIFKLDESLRNFKPRSYELWDSKTRFMQKHHIRKFIEGIFSVSSNWLSNGFDEICYLYRKEYIFHHKAILDVLTNATQTLISTKPELALEPSIWGIPITSPYHTSDLSSELDDWSQLLYNYTRIPLYHGLGEMVTANRYFLTDDVEGTINVRIPVLFKTFFISLYNRYKSLDEMLRTLSEYIEKTQLVDSMYFNESYELDDVTLETIKNNLSDYDDEISKTIERTLCAIYHPTKPFILHPYSNPYKDKENNKYRIGYHYILETTKNINIQNFENVRNWQGPYQLN